MSQDYTKKEKTIDTPSQGRNEKQTRTARFLNELKKKTIKKGKRQKAIYRLVTAPQGGT